MTRGGITVVLIGAALLMGVAGSGVLSHGSAEGATNKKSAGRAVAALDLNCVFKECRRFKAAIEKMRVEISETETKMRRETDKLKSQLEESQKLPAGSDERIKQEDQATKFEVAMKATIEVQKKVFLREEARIYAENYREIVREVDAYAKANGIKMVFKVSNDPMDSNKPEDVLRHVNSEVVWSAPGTDITAAIIERLNHRSDASDADGK